MEITQASHGTATEYCGLVFSTDKQNETCLISTGLGTHTERPTTTPVASDCQSHGGLTYSYAACYWMGDKQCPRGWKSYTEYYTFLPGCYAGSYYPNATPTSKTDIITGSQAHECHYN